MAEKSILDGEKIPIMIKDLDILGINIHQRRNLISASFSFCGRFTGMEIGLREGIQSAYEENLSGKYALEKIEEAMKIREDKRSIETISYSNQDNYLDF
jgi:hypothetical protein